MTDACTDCGHVHVAGDVTALGRFTIGPVDYRTTDGALHQTRADGQAHLCTKRQGASRG